MKNICYLNLNILGKYKNKVISNNVIITNERIEHIKLKHPGDYEKYFSYLPDIIQNPDYILEDKDNVDTLLLLKDLHIIDKTVQVVIKLLTNRNDCNKSNSILTFWHIRRRSYLSTIRNNKIIYKKLDINE